MPSGRPWDIWDFGVWVRARSCWQPQVRSGTRHSCPRRAQGCAPPGLSPASTGDSPASRRPGGHRGAGEGGSACPQRRRWPERCPAPGGHTAGGAGRAARGDAALRPPCVPMATGRAGGRPSPRPPCPADLLGPARPGSASRSPSRGDAVPACAQPPPEPARPGEEAAPLRSAPRRRSGVCSALRERQEPYFPDTKRPALPRAQTCGLHGQWQERGGSKGNLDRLKVLNPWCKLTYKPLSNRGV